MADWSLPTLASGYSNFLDYLKGRDEDAASLGYSAITNPITGQIRYVRATNKFQEYDGAAWNDKNLAIAGGGTGAATAANARTNLGLGTISTQDANNVSITGGAISGVSANANIITAGNLAVARMPVSGTWAITAQLAMSGHALKTAGTGVGYRTGGGTTLTDTDTIYVCTGGTVTLPDAIGCLGRLFCIKRSGTALTLATTSSQTIDGIAPGSIPSISNLEALTVQSDGANWNIVWRTGMSNIKSVQLVSCTFATIGSGTGTEVFSLGSSLTAYANAAVLSVQCRDNRGTGRFSARVTSNTQITAAVQNGGVDLTGMTFDAYVVEYQNVG